MSKLFKTRLFFQVVMATLVATLATVGIVAATTTIGTSINTGGTLTVTSTTATSTISTGGLAVGTNQFVVQQTSGNVGIGTSTPSNRLSFVDDSADTGIGFYDSNSNHQADLWFGTTSRGLTFNMVGLTGASNVTDNFFAMRFNSASDKISFGSNGTNGWIQSARPLYFSTGTINNTSLPQMVINTSGSVGIGTTNTLAKLSIFGSGTTAAASPATLYTASSTNAMWTASWIMGADLADAGKFKIASSTALGTNTRLTIDGSGNVGIGTTTPTTQLQITASATNATTTVTMGKVGQNKGTCHEEFRTDGSIIYWWWTIEGAVATSSASCK